MHNWAWVALDCGRGPMGDNADSQRIPVQIKESLAGGLDGHTALRIAVLASSKAVSESSDELACATNGLLERRIADLIQSRIRH